MLVSSERNLSSPTCVLEGLFHTNSASSRPHIRHASARGGRKVRSPSFPRCRGDGLRFFRGRARHRNRTHAFGRNDAHAFEHAVEVIHSQIGECLGSAGGPVNLQAVDLGCRTQPKVNSKIILREVAATTVNFVGLGHPSGDNLQPSANGQSIAFGSRQLETYPVATGNTMVLQDHWRSVDILDYYSHVAVIEKVSDGQST